MSSMLALKGEQEKQTYNNVLQILKDHEREILNELKIYAAVSGLLSNDMCGRMITVINEFMKEKGVIHENF